MLLYDTYTEDQSVICVCFVKSVTVIFTTFDSLFIYILPIFFCLLSVSSHCSWWQKFHLHFHHITSKTNKSKQNPKRVEEKKSLKYLYWRRLVFLLVFTLHLALCRIKLSLVDICFAFLVALLLIVIIEKKNALERRKKKRRHSWQIWNVTWKEIFHIV